MIRLIRAVTEPTGRGPGNGQYALQKALRARKPSWLAIGGKLQANETPWFWCWDDRPSAALCAHDERPFVAGPNILFDCSQAPGDAPGERDVLNAASCKLLFTESEWYRRLIESQRGPENAAPIVVWPYPIDPQPEGPAAKTEYRLLVYFKSARYGSIVPWLQRCFEPSRLVRYGEFQRPELWSLARRSACCVYVSDDDRGPLALAEILLCGCPVIGVPQGAPFIRHGENGILLERLGLQEIVEAVEAFPEFDRAAIAARAREEFSPDRIADVVVKALEAVKP